MKTEQIIALLPYQKPFLFVDGIEEVSENGIKGYYTFKKTNRFIKVILKIIP
ncbi:hypothetical protein JCM19302_2605 [Jejuia pallidilutea]|uniref:Uncharacterized protein n=1 Tax=Jejuia pallidilutea TaxID=504487 RepID=A0A090VZ54_9FLAO|nr:hypothetical protein JCM19302_2605 [Jejuia pallidilutea]